MFPKRTPFALSHSLSISLTHTCTPFSMSACLPWSIMYCFRVFVVTVAPTGQNPKLVIQIQLPVQPVVKPYIGPGAVVQPVTRPPLAGPYAFSRIPAPVWNKPRVFLTHALQDTWLFTNLSTRYLFGLGGNRVVCH